MAKSKKNDPNTLVVETDEAERKDTKEEQTSKLVADPAIQGAMTLTKLAGETFETTDITRSVKLATERAKRVSGGNLTELEEMMASQAATLDVAFNTLARRSVANMGDYMGAAETYMKLALRAQAQCRTTVAALAEIKNPKAVYISGQANISNGPQQVNNGVSTPVRAGARETESDIAPSKQSGGNANELRQDARAQSLEGKINPTLEAVGEVDRAKIPRGKGRSKSKRMEGRNKASVT